MKKILIFIILFLTSQVHAQVCVEVEQDNPLNPLNPITLENWCYQDFEDEGKSFRFLYQKEEGVKPELSYLIEFDENGKPEQIVNSSLIKDRTELVVSNYKDFNPLPFSLLSFNRFRQIDLTPSVQQIQQVNKLKEIYQEYLYDNENDRSLYKIEEGVFTEKLQDERLPFKGYWWPHYELPMATGGNSPTEIYDDLVPMLYSNWQPESVKWERKYHALEHVEWGGHCNGWVASSILHTEPQENLWDPYFHRVIYPSVQKGLLAENSFCVKWAFYGKRYRLPEDDLLDIYPDRFHKVLLYYIKKLRKPLSMDYVTLATVDNHPISGYNFEISKEGDGRYRVVATIDMHDYEVDRTENVGIAEPYSRRYEYFLTTDESGLISGGEWVSINPDFLWVPLSQQDCGRENPHIKEKAVAKILNFPVAKKITKKDIFEFDQMITEDLEVEIPMPSHPGANVYIQYSSQDSGWNDRVSAMVKNYYSGELRSLQRSLGGEGILDFTSEQVKTFKVQFYKDHESRPERRHFKINYIEYIGKP